MYDIPWVDREQNICVYAIQSTVACWSSGLLLVSDESIYYCVCVCVCVCGCMYDVRSTMYDMWPYV